MTIIDDLLAHTGLYIGVDKVADSDLQGGARMVVAALPGRIGVSLDYEVLNPISDGPVRGHVEHTVLARDHNGNAVMVIADDHAGGLTLMRQTEPGTFEPTEGAPYPMKVVLAMLEPGQLRHAWWYGGDEGAVERDVAVLTLTE
jgi:hypothetical protein